MDAKALIKVQGQHKKTDSDDDLGESEYKDDCHDAVEENPSDPSHCLEKPVTDVRHNAWRKKHNT